MIIFTWGHKRRILCRWTAPQRCACGASSWWLMVDWAYFTIFWIFGATSGHTYMLVCDECERRVDPGTTARQIDNVLGNPVPLRVRFGLLGVGAVFAVALMLGAGSTSSNSKSSAGETLWVVGFLILIAVCALMGNRSAYRGPEGSAVQPEAPTEDALRRLRDGAAALFAPRALSDSRSCPFCAETIKSAAIVCRYCGRDLVSRPETKSSTDETTATDKGAERGGFYRI